MQLPNCVLVSRVVGSHAVFGTQLCDIVAYFGCRRELTRAASIRWDKLRGSHAKELGRWEQPQRKIDGPDHTRTSTGRSVYVFNSLSNLGRGNGWNTCRARF